jgi:catechol-2,3-dioxygenase
MTGMTVTGRLELIALDATDIVGLAAFYADLTGWETVRNVDSWITLRGPDGQEVGFQEVTEHIPPQWPGQERPQQVHLDLLVDGYQEAAQRAEALGATRLADGATWITLADPAGHPFDLCQRDGVGPQLQLLAATFDAPDAPALARFYAGLLGMEVTYEGPEGAFVAGYGKSLMFQQVSDYTPPQWPDPAHPQQGHLDVIVGDRGHLEAVATHAEELGATRLGGGATWMTLADPAGHPFDLSVPG